MAAPTFRREVFAEFARIGRALAHEHRLEILDLLAQAPRNVEAIASETRLPVASVSQHLQVLRRARLVETEREGTHVRYCIADFAVLELCRAVTRVAERRLLEVPAIFSRWMIDGVPGERVAQADAVRLLAAGDITLIDVRPPLEYSSGHLPGALSVPLDEIEEHIDSLPRDRPIVTYCRGQYCLSADEAVAYLRARGFNAMRVEGGWTEWLNEQRWPGHGGLGALSDVEQRTGTGSGARRHVQDQARSIRS